MENNTEYEEEMKTTRRTRKSLMQLDSVLQNERSTQKIAVAAIEEDVSAPISVGPVTPNRLARGLDFQTPSRSEALATAQTPRRSVRKSIKPVQEYENIVAQKGLSSKQLGSSTLEYAEENAEVKWMPSVIGRVSAKRSKKARRTKKKHLQTEDKIEEIEMVGTQESNAMKDYKVPDLKDILGVILQPDEKLHVEESELGNNKKSFDDEELPDHGKANDQQDTSNKEVHEETFKEMIPSGEVHKDGHADDVSDDSMEGGDNEVATMPITADDCMERPEKLIKLSPKNAPLNQSSTANSTDDSDCIMLYESSFTEKLDSDTVKVTTVEDACDNTENNMPPLVLCSDEEDEAIDAAKKPEQTLNGNVQREEKSSTTGSNETTILNTTFDKEEFAVKSTSHTPMLRPSISRIATPFKSNKKIIFDLMIESEEEMYSDDSPDVLVEPRETTLKSSRKRSFSFCTDRPKKVVTFQSPANATDSIFNGDLSKSATKRDTANITQRRKRSLSVIETECDVTAYFKQTKTSECTPDKRGKFPQPSSRTKMPNFAAIHQQRFLRMESISDHVARKAERAKILSSSANKVKPASIQKGLPVKNSVLRDFNRDGTGNKPSLLPKARQRIELTGLKVRSKSRQDLSTIDDLPSIGKIPAKLNASTFVFTANAKPKLSKPKFDTTLNALKAPLNSVALSKLTAAASNTKTLAANTTIASMSHVQTNMPDPRPKFNMSTVIGSPAPAKVSNKLDDRRKRLMDMYKSRSAPRNGEKNREILKGVRTNRRFELQMMCRNRPN